MLVTFGSKPGPSDAQRALAKTLQARQNIIDASATHSQTTASASLSRSSATTSATPSFRTPFNPMSNEDRLLKYQFFQGENTTPVQPSSNMEQTWQRAQTINRLNMIRGHFFPQQQSSTSSSSSTVVPSSSSERTDIQPSSPTTIPKLIRRVRSTSPNGTPVHYLIPITPSGKDDLNKSIIMQRFPNKSQSNSSVPQSKL
jgi:hypothetical protein